MYEKIAKKITKILIEKNILKAADREIYEYSYEILISQTIYILIMLTIAIIFGVLVESLFFFLGFYLCRKISGGYHANTYLKCHILFAMNQGVLITLLKIPDNINWFFTLPSLFIAIVLILLFAPIDNENKQFDEKEFCKYRKACKKFCVILAIIAIITWFVGKNNIYCFCFSIGVLSVSVSLLYAFIERRFLHEINK